MSDILERIVAYKREDVRARRTAPPKNFSDHLSMPRGFREALRKAYSPGQLPLIAEIKKASPSRGVIRSDFDPPALARAYEAGGATCLSVLTDGPSFQGADDDLITVRGACDLPCLRKEFLIDPWQVAESRALGADAVLVILALADDSLARDLMSEASRLGMDVLTETHDREEFRRAARLGADLIGVNNRDLRTFVTDLAVTENLAEETPVNTLLVTESGIYTPSDAARMEAAGARAMLVGESLMRATDVETATRVLLGMPARST
jgi:indole-3-glycerol phosphate synthase